MLGLWPICPTDQIHPPQHMAQPAEPSGNTISNPKTNAERITAITNHLSTLSSCSRSALYGIVVVLRLAFITIDADLQPDTKGTLPADTDLEPFRPYIIHGRHAPVPIALVNRVAHGRPGHGDTVNPQDAAFLAGFRFARKNVFIQTPTFNAPPVVEACLEAVKRGIECTLYLDLGFNDEGELLPYQGGTNEDVSEKMYKELDDDHKQLLRVFWYTGKRISLGTNKFSPERTGQAKIWISLTTPASRREIATSSS